uniref:Uncharacterized protein n=1 Tax=Strongyloides papillosus TaxID=174720 RepID=A0A0N5CAF9_STREA
MYSNHKFHIKLTSTIVVNRISNDDFGTLYELQFSDNTYTFWATEKDIQKISKQLEKLMSDTEVKRKSR